MPLGITYRVAAHSVTVRVTGEIDLATRDEFRAALHHAGEYAVERSVVADLDAVTFMDAGGVGVLVRAANTLRGSGRRLVVRTGQPAVLRLLRVCRLPRSLALTVRCTSARRWAGRVTPQPLSSRSAARECRSPSSAARAHSRNPGARASQHVRGPDRSAAMPKPRVPKPRSPDEVSRLVVQWQADRSAVSRATGVLMQRYHLSPGAAETVLRELADELGITVTALARAIVSDAERRS